MHVVPPTPGDRDQLEAELRAEWTPSNLERYAELLRREGDPRGEVIALAQRRAGGDVSPALAEQHRAAVERWLGAEMAAKHGAQAATGFVEIDEESSRGVLSTELGELVRRVHFESSLGGLAYDLQALAERPRPWCTEVAWDTLVFGIMWERTNPRVAAVCARAPALRKARGAGSWLSGWPPEQLHALALDVRAAVSLARTADVLSAVTELALDFAGDQTYPYDQLRSATLVAQLPALRRLSVTLQPGDARVRDNLYSWLALSSLVPRLAELRVPAPDGAHQREQLERVRARMPGTLVVEPAGPEVVVAAIPIDPGQIRWNTGELRIGYLGGARWRVAKRDDLGMPTVTEQSEGDLVASLLGELSRAPRREKMPSPAGRTMHSLGLVDFTAPGVSDSVRAVWRTDLEGVLPEAMSLIDVVAVRQSPFGAFARDWLDQHAERCWGSGVPLPPDRFGAEFSAASFDTTPDRHALAAQLEAALLARLHASPDPGDTFHVAVRELEALGHVCTFFDGDGHWEIWCFRHVSLTWEPARDGSRAFDCSVEL
jgi:hypothetical protein